MLYTTKQKGCWETMTDKFFNAMGLCRRAKQLSIGHDEVKANVRNGKALLVIITADASPRIEKEMRNLSDTINIIRINASMADMLTHIGKRSGVYAVTDNGLKDLVLSTIKEDSIYGTTE